MSNRETQAGRHVNVAWRQQRHQWRGRRNILSGEARITRERKTEHVRGSGRQNMPMGEAPARQAELVSGKESQNMSVGEEGRTCLWEMQSEHVSRRGRQNMPVGEEDRTCQRERQAEHVSGRESQKLLVGEEGRTCQWERQANSRGGEEDKHASGRDRQNMSFGDHVSGGGMQDMSE
jgi:hypothetical protein